MNVLYSHWIQICRKSLKIYSIVVESDGNVSFMPG